MRALPTGKRKSPPPSPRRAQDPTAAARADLLRRFVLGFVTALIVARPLVLGEDPGLLASVSHPSSLIITVFWLLAAVGWAVWRVWAGQEWRGSWVEVALLATVGCVVLSAAVAAWYKHPAWLICWEWFVLLIAFCLVRQLARAPGDNRGLLAALLATGVTLSAYAVYQYTVEFPRARDALQNLKLLRQELAQESVFFDSEFDNLLPEDAVGVLTAPAHAGFPGNLAWAPLLLTVEPNGAERDLRLARWEERIQAANVFSTYSHPNSFAGFLVLLLPALVGIAWASGTGAPNSFRFGPLLVALCAGLVALALWLTHSRGAILGLLLAALVLAAVLGWSLVQRYKVWIATAFILCAGVGWWAWQSGWIESAFGKGKETSSRRLEYWSITGAMIADHPWLGVGPGNFGRLYPRYMPAAAFEKLQDPHNFILEMWASSGLFGAAALLAALAALFWQLWRARTASAEALAADDSPEAFARLRWEFCLGGVAGLLLGFVLRASNLAPDFILMEGVMAGVRSLIWFAAFAVIDGVLWNSVRRGLVLAAGILALLVNLLVSGGISFPSVAQPLWIMAALALNAALPTSSARPLVQGNRLRGFLPIPALGIAWLAYMILVYGPVTNGAEAVSQARQAYLEWRDRQEPYWRARVLSTEKEEQRHHYSTQAQRFLEARILTPLEKAVREDPGNAAHLVELSHWAGERWKLFPRLKKLGIEAWEYADRAQQLDPEGKQGLQAKLRLHRLFAQTLVERGNPAEAPQQYGLAVKALEELVKRDPNDPRLRFQLAEMLFLMGEVVKGREVAAASLELHRQALEAGRRLTDRQRRQVERWLVPMERK